MAWYTAGGAPTPVAAYQPIGAASLAASYVNLANPGTNDAAPGTAPTWAAGTGWTFNGTSQYLNTGITPTAGYSAIVRFSGSSADVAMIVGATGYFGIWPQYSPGTGYYQVGAGFQSTTGKTSGVMCTVGNGASSQGYYNGAADGAAFTATSPAFGPITIAGTNGFWPGDVQAVAIYNTALTAGQVAAITSAMQALPVAALLPIMLQHAEAGMI